MLVVQYHDMQKLVENALFYRVPGAATEPHPVRDAVCCLVIQGVVQTGGVAFSSCVHGSIVAVNNVLGKTDQALLAPKLSRQACTGVRKCKIASQSRSDPH